MNIGQQILFFISALGAFNGILLSLYLFFNPKRRTVPAFLLACLLLAISIRTVKSVFVVFNPDLPKIFLQIGLSACFLIGPSLYYFIRSGISPVTKIPLSWKIILSSWLFLLIIGGIIVPYDTNRFAWNNYIAQGIYLQWMVYVLASGYLLVPTIVKFFRKDPITSGSKFLLLVYFAVSFIFIVYLLALTGWVTGIYLSGPISFSFFLYLTIFYYFYNRKVDSLLSAVPVDSPAKTEKKKIAQEDADLLMEKLNKVIRDKALFKDPNLKLNHLASHVNITPHLLSQLLNDNAGKSFSTYINEFRIEEACYLISTNHRLTFEAIGYEVGYNSKSTFYTAFKKVKDTTPALFKESLSKPTV
ncbi:helix-turn-helix domain-containing protein [Pseudoflavitalea rhizosphaerae]|uniref:helix-turn-helix domain-containing protein n=1 Tax=Pseudoflavitalea rhizosphaerae TaxID=1884793 RepID=UPI000F8F75C6|nr:helix-turn-helix domain-containing protein [Pseudoflavitalea rhizosphaerae]